MDGNRPQQSDSPNDSNQLTTVAESSSLREPLSLESSDPEPRTWVPRWQSEMLSGIGVMADAILVLFVCFIGYLPAFSGQFPVAAAVILSVVCLPTSAYLWFIAIRRMRWEHRNGGILKKSLSGGGIIFAIFVAIAGLILLFGS